MRPPVAPRILHDQGSSIVRYVEVDPARATTLFVTFTGFEGRRGDGPGFGEAFITALGHNCVAVKCVNRNNYSDLSVEDLRALVGPIAADHPRVVTYGQSGGAYAALYFAAAVGADLAVALSPRNSRDPLYRKSTTVIPPDWTDSHRRLREVDDPGVVKFVVFDAYDVQDRAFFAAEIEPLANVHALRIGNVGHPCTDHLLAVGALKPLVTIATEAADGHAAAAAMAEAIRSGHHLRRRQSPAYLSLLARRLAQRGKGAAFDHCVGLMDGQRQAASHIERVVYGYKRLKRRDRFRAELDRGLALYPRSPLLLRYVRTPVASDDTATDLTPTDVDLDTASSGSGFDSDGDGDPATAVETAETATPAERRGLFARILQATVRRRPWTGSKEN